MCGLGYHEERAARQGGGRCALSSPSAMPRATTDHHPATRRGPRRPPRTPARWPAGRMIPHDRDEVLVALGDRRVKLTNLRKLFWPALGITKGDLIRYYVDLAPVLLPHLGMPSYSKTTGSRGVHVYVPIVRGPTQKEVWTVARTISVELARHHPQLITAEYSMARRPRSRVLVDYNQNAWGRTLASVYSVRPTPRAAVSTPVTWAEVERGIAIDDFRIDNVPARVRQRGDLWAPLLAKRGRARLERFV